ncbi:DUF2599 domain-containing protein [Luteimicrobium subarcticum]|uniref:Uncharacterized protein DUF2599 n=1 Tax=Luteimicrobium subarcticum TaxID=620910 RepID=A0A2M8WSB0_9MICO|nr:DUF2599 domain-containing protein [Luteimicrobium subarcticum]PJI93810.1 uncharacterized protein DUF2599 [Luteimicrobium subarcticum]
MRTTRRASGAVLAATLTGVLAAVLALAGCHATPDGPGREPSASGTAATAGPAQTAAATPAQPSATVDVGPVRLRVTAPVGATLAMSSGTTRVAVRHLDGAPVVVTVDRPAGAALTVELDGSVAVEDASGRAVGGLAAPEDARARGTRTRVRVTPEGGTLVLRFGDGTPRSATWGVAEGGRSLAVDPNAWARAAGQAGAAATWTAVTTAHPDADTPGMHDQLLCHAIGAPDKATWNLEPWRPDVGLVETVAARCNP